MPDETDYSLFEEEVFQKLERCVDGYLGKKVRDFHDRQDLRQKIFLAAYLSTSVPENAAKFILGIAKNKVIDYFKKAKYSHRVLTNVEFDPNEELKPAFPGSEDLNPLNADDVERAIASMATPRERELFRLRFRKKLTYDQIARKMKMSKGNAHRIYKKLSQKMQKRGLLAV